MERATLVHCCGCQQPIMRSEDFVCFKMPGSIAYSGPETAGKSALRPEVTLERVAAVPGLPL
jgi:hypothetical protein